MDLPSLFDYTELLSFLRAWTEAHEDGLSDHRVKLLADAAGGLAGAHVECLSIGEVKRERRDCLWQGEPLKWMNRWLQSRSRPLLPSSAA